MITRVELADPLDLLDDAASVLQEAWSPPCPVYDAPYLGWQLTFPSRLPRVAAVARDASAVVGFAGAAPRSVQIGEWTGDVVIVSFVSVRPAFRGQGVADRLYDALLGELRARGTPVVTFAEPGSVGERALMSAYARAGFVRHELGTCNPFGCVAQPAPSRARVVPAVGLRPFARLSEAGVRLSTDADQLRHFAADPRWRCAVTIENGSTSAGLLAVAAPVRTTKGQDVVLTIDLAFAPFDAADALRDGADAAAASYRAKPGSMVVFHNAPIRDTERARRAGLRRLPARFAAHLCLPPGLDILAEANPRGTNLDVV